MPLPGGTKDFMGKPAPLGYVAGLGRGASGFTTQSDIGPARENAPQVDPLATRDRTEVEDDRIGDDNEAGLLSNLGPYDQDDVEADKIYAGIDDKLDERRRSRREAREADELQQYRKSRPKIQQQFEDLKRSMKDVTEEEWMNIPEVGDYRAKKMKKAPSAKERYTPVPDSIIEHSMRGTEYVTSLDGHDSGLVTPSGTQTSMTDFRQIGQAREKQLGHKLDQIVSDSVSGQTNVDPTGYLTGLSSMAIKSTTEISDIKRATVLLTSLVTTHPDNPSGWISLARVEEEAGRIAKAREHLVEAMKKCPKSEDVWLEAARLDPQRGKEILAEAVQHVPHSVKIWLRAATMETDTRLCKKILRKALEYIPNSVKLWKTTIEMEEEEENARVLLAHAVECIPSSVEMWLALARLETRDNARRVLNKARQACPTSHEIWIGAAKLEEQASLEDAKMIDMLIQRGVSTLASKGASLTREQWIKEAQAAESSQHIRTCQAIIRATIGTGVEDEDRKVTWLEDAEAATGHGSFHTARAIYAHALEVFPGKKSIWKAAAFFEKQHGTRETLEKLLAKAVQAVPQAEVLWLMAAKERWQAGDVPGSRDILSSAFCSNPNSEQIWLAAVKLEYENGRVDHARTLLQKAREQANTPRVWMKSAALERQSGQYAVAISLLLKGIDAFPSFDKFWMMLGQIYECHIGDMQKARLAYAQGLKKCPSSIPIWRLAAALEEKQGQIIKARALLESGRLTNPKNAYLWLDSVRIEDRQGNRAMSKALLAKGLQECPMSGVLWAEAIGMEPRPSQKSKGADAWRRCPNDPLIALALARVFWADRQLDKAKSWFERAIQLDSDYGDTWVYAYAFENAYGSPESTRAVLDRAVAADPHHGEKWPAFAKRVENYDLGPRDVLLGLYQELTAGNGSSSSASVS